MKDWEIIAKNISNRGWTLGWVSGVNARGRTIWITDARRNGKRFIVHADEKLTAFAELETSIFKRAKIRWENAAIRQAVLRAAAQEQRKCEFKLFGRGHESRVTLSVSLAPILRGLDIPRVYVSGTAQTISILPVSLRRLSESLKRSGAAHQS